MTYRRRRVKPGAARARFWLLALALATTLAACGGGHPRPSPPPAGTSATVHAGGPAVLADRIAKAWAPRQLSDGLFVDESSRAAPSGFGPVWIGYGLIRAGLREHREGLVLQGLRAVNSELLAPRFLTGVFEELAFAEAYNFARVHLARDPAFVARRRSWEHYLVGLTGAFESPLVRACITGNGCFHNEELVQALRDVELLHTGLVSRVTGAWLADRPALRAFALRTIGAVAPAFTGRAGRSSGPGPTRELGLLTDSGSHPLAYDALSTMMLAQGIERLGAAAPPAARRALMRATESLAAFMAPDGDVAFIGRRQEQAWVLAVAAAAGQIAARLAGPASPAAARFRALAGRALSRLAAVYRVRRFGLEMVPRGRLAPGDYYRGIDVQNTNYNGLTIYALEVAADEAQRDPAAARGPLAADRNGFFVDPDQARFATVRHGDLWYAVHALPYGHDLRNDFGLVVLKRQGPRDRWTTVVQPRPFTVTGSLSSGPVLVRGGRRWLPGGRAIAAQPGGVVVVDGGWRSTAGTLLPRRVTFRWAPVSRGVQMSLQARPGDVLQFTAFLSAGSWRRTTAGVSDQLALYTVAPHQGSVSVRTGFSSCCARHLAAATMTVRAPRDGAVTWTVRAPSR